MSKFLKKLAIIVGIVAIVGATFAGCQKTTTKGENSTKENTSSEELQTVRLNEVVRSVFYAPMYVAISESFFEEEGLKIDLSTGQGADKTMQQLLSGNVDIGFSGPEQAVYIYNQGREDYPVVFGQLTQRDGSFLVGRQAEENFDWASLKSKEIIGGRPGGIPEMALEYVLKENGLDPATDVNMVTNVDFTATSGAFKSGTGDYVALFEPTATMLENDGGASIVASVGESAGNIAYTCFYTTKSYMDENPEILQKFTNSIYKGQQWVKEHTSEEIAQSIHQFFPDMEIEDLVTVVERYQSIDAWATDPVLKEDSLNNLMDVMELAGQLDNRAPYETIVDTSYAENAINNIK